MFIILLLAHFGCILVHSATECLSELTCVVYSSYTRISIRIKCRSSRREKNKPLSLTGRGLSRLLCEKHDVWACVHPVWRFNVLILSWRFLRVLHPLWFCAYFRCHWVLLFMIVQPWWWYLKLTQRHTPLERFIAPIEYRSHSLRCRNEERESRGEECDPLTKAKMMLSYHSLNIPFCSSHQLNR